MTSDNRHSSFGFSLPSCPPPRPSDVVGSSFPSQPLPKPPSTPTHNPSTFIMPSVPSSITHKPLPRPGGIQNKPATPPNVQNESIAFPSIPTSLQQRPLPKPLPKPNNSEIAFPSTPSVLPSVPKQLPTPPRSIPERTEASINLNKPNLQRMQPQKQNQVLPNLPKASSTSEIGHNNVHRSMPPRPQQNEFPNVPQRTTIPLEKPKDDSFSQNRPLPVPLRSRAQTINEFPSIPQRPPVSPNASSTFAPPPIPQRDPNAIKSFERSNTSPIVRRDSSSSSSEISLTDSPKWTIKPLENLKLSKTKRPEIPKEHYQLEVTTGIGNNLLSKVQYEPEIIYRFTPSICFELLRGKLYDANYELFPQPKPPNRYFEYQVDIVLANQAERHGENHVGEIRLYRLDKMHAHETIPLQATLPCLALRPRVYMFRSAGPRFFIVELPQSVTPDILSQFDELLMDFGLLHRMNPKGRYQEQNIANSSATAINTGGEVLGKGIAKGSAFLGKGLRSASNLYTSNTKKHESKPKDESELSEKELKERKAAQKRMEGADKASSAFVSGTRGVKQGIRKGFGFVGKTGAQVADGSSKAIKGTDWYKEREQKKIEGKPPKEDKGESAFTGVVNIAKSSLNAGSSVISGVKQGTRTVAKDVRESTVSIAEHSKGEGVGAKTRQGFNIAGKTALGGAFVVQLTAVESWHTIIYTGAGAAQYDPDKKEILAGIAWKVGWMTKQGSYMNPWSPRFAVLRTYSISFYKDPKHSQPSSYIKLEEIKNVEFAPFSETEKNHCIRIQTKSDLYYFSLDLGEEACEKLEIDRSKLDIDREAWINSLKALVRVDTLSKFKKKAAKKDEKRYT